MDTKSIIEFWYKKLNFPSRYDEAFYRALEEIEIPADSRLEDYDYKSEDGRRNLLAYLYFCEELKRRYEEKGIGEDILLDTLSDLVVWTDVWSDLKGELWLSELYWLNFHFGMRLFKLGRLQFCLGKAKHDAPTYGLAKGDTVVEVHIQAVGPLKRDDCLQSMAQARAFFAKYYPEQPFQCFTCHSWLMDKKLDEVLGADSNIIRFRDLFDIVHEQPSDAILKYVFRWDTEAETLAKTPATSGFAQRVKDRRLAGEMFNEAFGVRRAEEQRTIAFPYGKEFLRHDFARDALVGVLTSAIEEYKPEADEVELVRRAMQAPIGSKRLSELAVGKQKVVIIASDHTRPVPSKVIIPAMLAEIRQGNPDADITILIATGCHRGTTKAELVSKFGEEIVARENIYVHDCDEREKLVSIGTLPSGGDCEINTIAAQADLLVAEGFIEPHFFAGFSGGRKSVLPGIAGRGTVLANHCAEFIAHENARTGVLADNPVHEDMLWAAKKANLQYIVNVVLNAEKQVIYAVAGDVEQAHKKGTDFLASQCGARAVPADIVISTNGGYPLDQNVYQAVKGMTAAEATVKEGGVIIMIAAANDGIGGDHFYHQLADERDITKTMQTFLSRGRNETVPDQWQTQIMLRVLMQAKVIFISEMTDELVEQMHMIPAHSIEEAIDKAKALLNQQNPTMTAIPDGVSVVVQK